MRTILAASAFALATILGLAGATPTTNTQYAGIINQTVDTGSAYVGQTVTLRDVVSEDDTVSGATMSGHVSSVVRAGTGRAAQLRMVFTTLTLRNGTRYAIDGVVTGMQAKTKTNVAREVIGGLGGMAVGNIIAKTVFHASSGIGGFLGAAGGYLVAKNMRQNMNVPAGSAVRVTLRSIRRQASRP